MTFTPTICGVWRADQITSTTAAEIFIAAHAKTTHMQNGRWRCWLRKLPAGDNRAAELGNGLRFYGLTSQRATWEASIWLYRSWLAPEAPERRIGARLL